MAVIDRVDPEYLPVIKLAPLIDLRDIPAARVALEVVFAMMGEAEPNPEIIRSDHAIPNAPGAPDSATAGASSARAPR